MFKEFENWFSTNEFSSKGLTINTVKPPRSEKTGMYVDLVSNRLYARATLWESGELDVEAIDAGTERTLIYNNYVVQNKEQLFSILREFVEKLM